LRADAPRVGGVTTYPGTFGRFIEVSAPSSHIGVRFVLALSHSRGKTGARFSGKSYITKK
jgi:hypothetical protein